jgi:chemotaxis signal transduction protein
MDRNLYERANDCRWWALSPVLREQLASDTPDDAALARVLDGINRLYTVYSRLVAFDAQGVIRAASRSSEGDGLPGSAVPGTWLQAVAQLGDAQRYAVSPFEDTTLHDQGPTYVYLAAVRDPADERRIVGGIAVVFSSSTELAAMLRDVMADRGGFAAFVDTQGRVLAATDPALAGGVAGQLDGRAAAIVGHDGTHYAVARMQAGGYREFKSSDGYDNGVTAVIGLRLGNTERRQTQLSERDLMSPGRANGRDAMEIAVFQVGSNRYALRSAEVMEAISTKGLVHTPGTHGAAVGMIEVPAPGGARLVPALCARRLFNVDYPARASDGVLLVVRSALDDARPAFALRVDDVLTVLDVPRDRMHPAPEGFVRFAPWVQRIVECTAVGGEANEAVLVQLLDSRLVGGDTGVDLSLQSLPQESPLEALV